MKLLINDLLSYLKGLSPIYNAPIFQEVLSLNDDGDFTTVFRRILERSLSEYELKYPLLLWDKSVYIPLAYKQVEMTDNYQAYLDNIITEDNLQLIPTSIVHYTDSLLRAYRDFTYIQPYLKVPRKGVIKISYLAKYKVIIDLDKHEPKLKFTEGSHIYGLNLNSGPEFTYFGYILELNLCTYLRELKQQISYSDLPIEIYQGLDDRISKLQEDIQDWYQSPVWYGRLLI